MHGNRPEHPEVFKARMQHHKDAKKTTGSTTGSRAPDKDAAQDKAETQKRKAVFQRKAVEQAKADEKKPARGVLTHLQPDQ